MQVRRKKMNYLIINEQHNLFLQQENILKNFGEVKIVKVPAAGWTLEKLKNFEVDNKLQSRDTVIFASPIPFLIKELTSILVWLNNPDMSGDNVGLKYNVLVFHNDKRDKLELPNGKIINRVSAEGWMLV